MAESELLTFFAEIFLTLAGFTGIVAVLGQRSEGKWRPVDLGRFRGLLEGSLAGLFFSVMPIGFYYFGVGQEIIWSISSGIFAVLLIGLLVRGIRKQKDIKATSDPDFVPGVRQVILIIAVPTVITLLLNATGLGFERTFAPYLLGLIAMLFGCCAMFVLLLRFVRNDP